MVVERGLRRHVENCPAPPLSWALLRPPGQGWWAVISSAACPAARGIGSNLCGPRNLHRQPRGRGLWLPRQRRSGLRRVVTAVVIGETPVCGRGLLVLARFPPELSASAAVRVCKLRVGICRPLVRGSCPQQAESHPFAGVACQYASFLSQPGHPGRVFPPGPTRPPNRPAELLTAPRAVRRAIRGLARATPTAARSVPLPRSA